jgi:hypothetical protein
MAMEQSFDVRGKYGTLSEGSGVRSWRAIGRPRWIGHVRASSPWLLVLAFMVFAGCQSRRERVGVEGDVTFEGKRIAWGKVDFVPVEDTPGSSACAPIAAGHYEIPSQWGLLPDGVYQVQIVGFRKTGRREAVRSEFGGVPSEVAENYIPPAYNGQTVLRVRMAEVSNKNRIDFRLPVKP